MLVNRASASAPFLIRGWNCSKGKISATTTLADIFLAAFFVATTSTTKRAPSVDTVATLTSGIRDSFSARQDRIGRSASTSPATRSWMITSVLLVALAGVWNVKSPDAVSAATTAAVYPLIARIIDPLGSSASPPTPTRYCQGCFCLVLTLSKARLLPGEHT